MVYLVAFRLNSGTAEYVLGSFLRRGTQREPFGRWLPSSLHCAPSAPAGCPAPAGGRPGCRCPAGRTAGCPRRLRPLPAKHTNE